MTPPPRRPLSSRPPSAPPLPSNIHILDDHELALQLLFRLKHKAAGAGFKESARRYEEAIRAIGEISLPVGGAQDHTLPGTGKEGRE